MSEFIYLASQSPRRLQLLAQWGVRCELLLPDADEDVEALEAVLPGEAPAGYVQRVTGLKLQASLARLKRRGLPPAPVLCADTTVALGRRILGKPQDAAEARRMLADLSGRTHRVLTAVAVGQGSRRWHALSTSTVTFDALTQAQIRRYVDGGGEVGFVSSVSDPFCGDCHRARLSADGQLFTCLFANRGTPLREVIAQGEDALAARLGELWRARGDRYSEQRGEEDRKRRKIEMFYIGG